MDLVTLPDVEDIRVNLDENVRAVLFAKMLIADSEAEVDELWAEYLQCRTGTPTPTCRMRQPGAGESGRHSIRWIPVLPRLPPQGQAG